MDTHPHYDDWIPKIRRHVSPAKCIRIHMIMRSCFNFHLLLSTRVGEVMLEAPNH